MQLSADIRAVAGVTDCLVAMGTPLNADLLQGMGFAPDHSYGPNDLVVAIRASSGPALEAGLAAMEAGFARLADHGTASGKLGDQATPPRTVGGAARDATLALISVPGPYAFVEAMDAITSGLNVMLFSDNVDIQDEVTLKRAAAARGVLVMGPDCGTAVVGGVAVGFANAVQPGHVGLVAASGTGAQQVMSLLDLAGVGISHCLGVGGRDLSAAVQGRSTLQALAALADDPETTSIVVVSKPPAPDVLDKVRSFAASLPKPVHWATLSYETPDLTAAVESALLGTGHAVSRWPARVQPDHDRTHGALRGLYCGGTLAHEAMLLMTTLRGPVRSNIPLAPELALGPDLVGDGDLVIDFGDDMLTRGRPHPVIDPSLRLERIVAEGADPTCGVLLLDLVLGFGAHASPEADLADAIKQARASAKRRGTALPVVVSLVGTAGDPQNLARCREWLYTAGASVFASNAQATRHALAMLAREPSRQDFAHG
jgi:FdrA protein